MTQSDNPTLFPEWLRKAVELGYSPIELARLLGTTPATVAQLIRSVPTRPAEVRKLARQLGIDYESFRTFADNALQPITGFDRDTQRLLRLSVPPPDHQELVDVIEVVDDTLSLLAWEAQERRVDIRQGADSGPVRVMATDTELRMAVLNLAQNALHAMPQGGTLDVTCARRDVQVEIAFTDTGVGIPRQDLGRIFQPFFSRRADGVHGTGLGLSITKAFVEHHGGGHRQRVAVGDGTAGWTDLAGPVGHYLHLQPRPAGRAEGEVHRGLGPVQMNTASSFSTEKVPAVRSRSRAHRSSSSGDGAGRPANPNCGAR